MNSVHANGHSVLQDRVAALFAEKLQIEVSSAESDLFEMGVLDSLKFVELLVHLEEEFGTKCSLEDLEIDNFRSVARIAAFVTDREAPATGNSSLPR